LFQKKGKCFLFASKFLLGYLENSNVQESSSIEKHLNLALQGSVFLLALAAPISIAATQTAWALALLFWILRAIFVRPQIRRDVFGGLVLAFVGLSLLSSVFSYEPQVSLRKMVSVMLISIVFLVAENVREQKTFRRLVVVLLISGVFTVAYTVATRIVGKNLKVWKLSAESPLRKIGIQEGDIILTANGTNINSPDDLISAISSTQNNATAKLVVYRFEFIINMELPVSSLLAGTNSTEKLGINEWSRGRDTRAAGFYGHYTTYAEALQLIASLSLGLLIVAKGGLFSGNRILLALAVGALSLALLLTVTRASWFSFFVSASVMILLGASRKTILICVACAVPLVLAGVFFLQQKRRVGFVDTKDASTTWRLTVWREGFDLLKSKPRHLLVGIGMDSIKTHWREWRMFDDGKIPIGHMHSTPLQLALERGIPTFLVWLTLMFFYLRTLWRALKRNDWEWYERGFLLGAFGGTIGFLTSSTVHYNWGDSEVVMIFYLLMGLSLSIIKMAKPLECGGTGTAFSFDLRK
jgi:O-antigen ligase